MVNTGQCLTVNLTWAKCKHHLFAGEGAGEQNGEYYHDNYKQAL